MLTYPILLTQVDPYNPPLKLWLPVHPVVGLNKDPPSWLINGCQGTYG